MLDTCLLGIYVYLFILGIYQGLKLLEHIFHNNTKLLSKGQISKIDNFILSWVEFWFFHIFANNP